MSYIDIKKVNVQNDQNEIINPAQDETIILLRKLLHIAQSLSVIDSAQRQRVAVEAMPTTTVTGTLTVLTTLNQLAGVDARQQFQDANRNVFANAIRSKIEIS